MIYAAIPVALALLCVFLGRRILTIHLIFAYLTIEGFLKMLSNYNRIVHVGLDIIVVSMAGWLVLEAIVKRRAWLPHLPYARVITFFAIWVVLQLLNPYSPGLVPSIAAFKIHLTMIPLYFIAATSFEEPGDVMRFLTGIVVISMAPFVMALVQYAMGPSSVLDLSPRYWQNISYFHDWRPFGTSAVPGGGSVFAFIAAPLAMILLIQPNQRPSLRWLAVLAMALAAGTFIVSGVRQTFLGCLMTLMVMAVLMGSRGRGRGAVALGGMLIVGMAVFVGVQTLLRPMATEAVARDTRSPDIWRERDVTERLGTVVNTDVYRTARQNPLPGIFQRAVRYPFGAGLGRTGSAAGAFSVQYERDPRNAAIQREVGWSDNFFADMIVETGLPGMIMMTIVLIGLMLHALRLARRAEDSLITAYASVLAGFYFAILVMSWGSQPLMGNPITAYFWLLSGILAACERMEAAGVTSEAPGPSPWSLPVPVGAR